MATATLHRPRLPHPDRGTMPAFVLALTMHAMLFLGMWLAMQWKTQSDAVATAELWAPLPPPQIEKTEPKPAPPPPPPKVEPKPEPEKKDADIVVKQEKKKEPPKVEPTPEPTPDPQKIEAERKKLELERKRAELERQQKAELERKKREAEAAAKREAQLEAQRKADLERLLAQANTGTAPVQSSGRADPGYIDLVRACIRPHIVYAVPEGTSAQIYAEFQLDLLPTGEQAGAPRLTKSSGLAGYDAAAERAIRRCDPIPRKKDGTVDRTLIIRLYPVEAR
jgi:colicin import membrane protein